MSIFKIPFFFFKGKKNEKEKNCSDLCFCQNLMEFAKISMSESLKTYNFLKIWVPFFKSNERSGVMSEIFPYYNFHLK
jgi:hypothetical protein